MKEIVQLLIENNLSIGSVESFTVGKFASRIGSVPGVSKVYRGSLVTYQTEIKHRLLGIDQSIIERFGVVSKEVASLMARNGQKILDCDICVSFTGNAGPSAMEGKEVGEVYVGLSFKDDHVVYKLQLSGNREDIANQAILFINKKILEKMQKNEEI